MESICGANCNDCELLKRNKCRGCRNTNGCPFGKKCWIANYIEIGGKESFQELKTKLIEELNSLNIDGMPKINELYPLNGYYINMDYQLPNGKTEKILQDEETYLGNQLECEFNDNKTKKYFGIATNMNFILVSEYNEDKTDKEIIIYRKR